MYSQAQAFVKRSFVCMALLALWTLVAYGQQANDAAAKPLLPASSSETGKDVAKTELPPTETSPTRPTSIRPSSYIIGVGDGLDINVWKESELSKSVAVRPDGMISLPLVGEIKAVGLTPVQLQEQIAAALQKVMSDPQVTVIVTGVNSLSFNIMGNVLKPGFYPMVRPLTILDAIALSGGFRDFAKEKKIYVLRKAADGTQKKIKFNYKEVIKGKNMAQNILLQPNDTLVIP